MTRGKAHGGGWALASVICASVVLLIGGYVGAYFALVIPIPVPIYNPPLGSTSAAHSRVVPYYRHGNLRALFLPIHQIDRRWLRPQTWKL